MPLPPPDGKVVWKNYKNETPTFRLTPVEKPDMSPYLIHMTGKRAIASILRGEGQAKPENSSGRGFLKANVPEYADLASESSGGGFDAPVVCFSESPTFSIDYFRYRSYARWKADLRYGIGFHKDKMIARGIRPVLYLDQGLTGSIVSLHHELHQENQGVGKDQALKKRLVKLIDALYPLIFPLLESHPNQGFMWEREWRHPDPRGLSFAHTEIAVICCPPEEEPGIRSILAGSANRIKFIRTWEEYDDVTDYLERQEAVWKSERKTEKAAASIDDKLKQIDKQIQSRKIVANQLDSYKDIIEQLTREAARAEEERSRLLSDVKALQEKKAELRKQRAKQAGAKPAKPSEEESGPAE